MNILLKSTTYKTLAFLSITMLAINHNQVIAHTFSNAAVPDSIGVEKIDGQEYVLFKIEKGDNYYQLSKKYKTTVGKITELNGNKTLALIHIHSHKSRSVAHNKGIDQTTTNHAKPYHNLHSQPPSHHHNHQKTTPTTS